MSLLGEFAFDWIFRKKRKRDAYKSFWRTTAGQIVFADLATFCGLHHPIIDADTNTTMSRLGARTVVLRIIKQAALTDEEIEAAGRQLSKGDPTA